MGQGNRDRQHTTDDELEFIRRLGRRAANDPVALRTLKLYRMSLPFRVFETYRENGIVCEVNVYLLQLELLRILGEPTPMEQVEGVEDYERIVVALADKRFNGGGVRYLAQKDKSPGPWDV